MRWSKMPWVRLWRWYWYGLLCQVCEEERTGMRFTPGYMCTTCIAVERINFHNKWSR